VAKRTKVPSPTNDDGLNDGSSLDDFLDELKEEGELDSVGSFSIDYSRAKQPFLELSDGILLILSALPFGGATKVAVQQMGPTWTLEFDASAPTRETLKNLLHLLFDQQTDGWLREIGLAINGLFPSHCSEICWDSGLGYRAHFSKSEWLFEDATSRPTQEIRLQLARSYPWQLKFWLGSKRLLNPLMQRLNFYPIPLEINGALKKPDPQMGLPAFSRLSLRVSSLNERFHLGEVAVTLEHLTRLNCSMLAAVTHLGTDSKTVSELRIIYRGLDMGCIPVTLPGFGLQLVVHTDRVDLDLSRRQVVQNERLQNLVTLTKRWVIRGVTAWTQQIRSSELQAVDRIHLLKLCSAVRSKKLREGLFGLPLVPASNAVTSFSLEELAHSVRRFGRLCAASTPLPKYLHDRPVIAKIEDQALSDQVQRMLQTRILIVDRWQVEDDVPLSQEGRLFSLGFERGDWKAQLIAFRQPGPSGIVKLLRRGRFFARQNEIKFLRNMLSEFVIEVDFDADESLDSSLPRILKELPKQILADLPTWLSQLCQMNEPSPEFRERFCQLLSLRQKYHTRKELLQKWVKFAHAED
jgi:hypothetical protein